MYSNEPYRILASNCARVFATILTCSFLVGCSGGGSASDDFGAALKQSANMPDEVADCFAELADEELSENARAFLVAGMRRDSAVTEALRDEMSFVEITQAGMFMASAGSRCGVPEE